MGLNIFKYPLQFIGGQWVQKVPYDETRHGEFLIGDGSFGNPYEIPIVQPKKQRGLFNRIPRGFK